MFLKTTYHSNAKMNVKLKELSSKQLVRRLWANINLKKITYDVLVID